MIEHRPAFARHVVGQYEAIEIDAETHEVMPVRVVMTCDACGEQTERVCHRGTPLVWIGAFGRAHAGCRKK